MSLETRAERLFRQSLTFASMALGLAVGFMFGVVLGIGVALVKFLVF